MPRNHSQTIAGELNLGESQVAATVRLLDEDATVPFIARYRKEATGSLDEVAVRAIRDRLGELREMDSRRETILSTIEEQGKLTAELRDQILAAGTMAELEDLYLPYKPKRRTRADRAREKGLEPLAELIFAQDGGTEPELAAAGYVDPENDVEGVEDALAGARDIIAEWVNENQQARRRMRKLYAAKATLRSRVVSGKEEEGEKFKDYFEWEETAASAPSHRVLAMRRGENEGFLYLRVAPPEEDALRLLTSMCVQGNGPAAEQVREAIEDCYKRLLGPSMETEMRMAMKERADEEAIRVFAENLQQLLLAPPLGSKTILAIDPGLRTGCKLAILDPQGKLLHHETVYPHGSGRARAEAAETLGTLCERFGIEAVAVGNGTAGRQTEAFVRGIDLPGKPAVLMVNESGASVYSASEAAREEFPDLDLTVRGTVSIGRRLMDPLAELVKIDPKSIGVGQYQHDVDQAALRESLDDVVTSCVNSVGVEVNTASGRLLTYVSGLGPKLAQAVVERRDEAGAFRSRAEIREVSGIGPKTFEQAAGFLRVRESENPLDATAVHPESYPLVEKMAADLGCSVRDLMRDAELRARINLRDYVGDSVGMPTLKDIMAELARPGRDPREKFEAFRFAKGVSDIEDLEEGMQLPGVVTNITNFGAFIDVGVHHDGLVHISELADRYVEDVADVVKLQQKVTVTVLDVDLKRKRISLSMRKHARPDDAGVKPPPKQSPRSTAAKNRQGKDRKRKDAGPPDAANGGGAYSQPFKDLPGSLGN